MTRKILGKSTLGTAVLFSTLAAAGQAFAAPSVTVYGNDAIANLDTDTDTAKPYGIAAESLTSASQAVDDLDSVIFTTSVKNPGGYTVTLSKAAFDSAVAYNLVVWKDMDSDGVIDDCATGTNTDGTDANAPGGAGNIGGCDDTDDGDVELYFLGDSSAAIVDCELTTSNTVLECGPLTGAMGVYADGASSTNLSSGSKLLLATGVSGDDRNSDLLKSDLIFDTDTTKSALSNGSSVTITIAETTNTGTDNGSDTENLATVTEQLEFCVSTPANGVIDLNAEPVTATEFEDNATTDTIVVSMQDLDDTSDTTCSASSAVGDFLTTNAYGNSDFTLTVTPTTKTGITSVVADGGALTYNSTTGTYSSSTVNFSDMDATNTVTITVDGTTTLIERDFSVTLKGVDSATTTYLSSEDAGAWNMNGYTAYIPHMLVGNTSYQTFIKIVNLSERDADVLGSATICDSSHASCVSETGVDLGTVSATSSMFITETELVNAFDNLVSGSSYQVDGTLIVNAPIDQVAVTAITKTVADGSRATMSVLTETAYSETTVTESGGIVSSTSTTVELPLKQ